MTTSFYAPPSAFREPDYVELPEEEAAHAVQVLRKRPGDEIVVVDGDGGWYRVRLDQLDRHKVAGEILERRREVGEPVYDLSIGLSLLKSRHRFETFLEKAVELGVGEVLPLMTHRTEQRRFRVERARKILLAAMKQSGRSRLVRLTEPQPLADVLRYNSVDPGSSLSPDSPAKAGGRRGSGQALALIGHERTAPEHSLSLALAGQPLARTIRILIGPEGGFTEEEVAQARQAGYAPVSLGPRRLRAETAALVAASTVMITRSR